MLAPNNVVLTAVPTAKTAPRLLAIEATNRRLLEPAALGCVLLLALFLRFWGIDKHCFWLDEVYSIQKAAGHCTWTFAPPTNQYISRGFVSTDPFNGTLADVFAAMKTDTHPPLYTLVLRYWRQLVGVTDGATRSLSALCGVMAILLLWYAVRTLHGSTAAFWAALLMAVATPQIDYGQEARSYAMVTMWVAAALAAVARIVAEGPNWRREAALVASLFCGIATHYDFVGLWAALMVFGLFQPKPVRSTLWRCGFVAILLAAVVLGPLLYLQRSTYQADMSWAKERSPAHVASTLRRAAVVPLRWFMSPMESSWRWAALFSGVLIFSWAAVRRRPALALWLLGAIFSAGLETLIDLTDHLQTLVEIRYVLAGAVPAYALAACLLSTQNRWLRHLIPASLVLGAVICLPQAYEQTRKANWDRLAADAARLGSPDTPLVFYQEDPSRDLFDPILQAGITRYSQLWQHPVVALTTTASPEVLRQLHQQGRFLLVRNGGIGSVEDFIPGCVATGREMTTYFVGEVSEYRFEDLRLAQRTPANNRLDFSADTAVRRR